MRQQLSCLSHPETLRQLSSSRGGVKPYKNCSQSVEGIVTARETACTADSTGHNLRQHRREALEEKPENVSTPNGPITMLTVCVAAVCSHFLGSCPSKYGVGYGGAKHIQGWWRSETGCTKQGSRRKRQTTGIRLQFITGITT